jgi:ACS family hexuronate transporter-like MFS transporter
MVDAMRLRWLILFLLFTATTINYLDRTILAVLLPEIRKQFPLDASSYGKITFAFQVFYGVGAIIGGVMLDRYGTRIGFGLAAALWSAAATMTAFAGSALQFGLFRSLLGLAESVNFPACNKATAEFLAQNERASAMGMINAGTNVANIIGPPIFIWLALKLSWQGCFALVGVLGFLWLPAWFIAYRATSNTDGRELGPRKLSILEVMKYKQAWGYAWAKFLTDPVWWFYLFWLPTYLNDVRRFSAGERATALTIVYAISGVGAVVGGLASSHLMKRGWPVGRARKTTMLGCAIIMPLCGLGVVMPNAWLAVLLFGVALAAHQAWMSNVYTTPGDVFPRQAVGSTNGFGVCAGALGGALFSGLIPGYVIPWVGYIPLMLGMSCAYLLAWWIVHRMMGDLSIVKLRDTAGLSAAGARIDIPELRA